MLTTDMLVSDWKQYAINSITSGVTKAMTEHFAECLGIEDGAAIFRVDGMKAGERGAISCLKVADDGFTCWDFTQEEPFLVGHFVPLGESVQ